MKDSFFVVTPDCSYWVSEFKDKLENYSDIKNNLQGLEYCLNLKEKIFQKFHCYYQIFQKEWILSHNHLSNILFMVNQVFSLKTNISKRIDIEFLLYLSIQKQIQRAIKEVGINFPKKPKDPINLGQIIFGEEAQVRKAVKSLSNQLKDSSFELNFDLSEKYLYLIRKYQINERAIQNQLIFKSSNPREFNHALIMTDFSEKDLKSSLLNAIFQKMNKMFLNNYKENSINKIDSKRNNSNANTTQ